MHDQRTDPLHDPRGHRGRPAPAWVLVLGAVLLVLALALTAYGPTHFHHAPTGDRVVRATTSGN